eukprot:3054905-Prymnesium_polylepis.2
MAAAETADRPVRHRANHRVDDAFHHQRDGQCRRDQERLQSEHLVVVVGQVLLEQVGLDRGRDGTEREEDHRHGAGADSHGAASRNLHF